MISIYVYIQVTFCFLIMGIFYEVLHIIKEFVFLHLYGDEQQIMVQIHVY